MVNAMSRYNHGYRQVTIPYSISKIESNISIYGAYLDCFSLTNFKTIFFHGHENSAFTFKTSPFTQYLFSIYVNLKKNDPFSFEIYQMEPI
jgi:hypothetical protein